MLSATAFDSDAAEVVVTGIAPIVRGDVGAARDLALRRALGLAAAQGQSVITHQADVQSGTVKETTHVVSSACTQNAQIIGERIADNSVTLEVSVDLDTDPECISTCQAAYINKLVITRFAMATPEHLKPGESSNINHIAANDLTQALRNGKRLRVETAETEFPYTSASRAPEVARSSTENSPFIRIAKERRAQYVITGIWQDFSIASPWLIRESRTLLADIFIHDGANGALLKHRQFGRTATGNVRAAGQQAFGNPAFYRSDLGQAWTILMADIADWVAKQTVCLPFIARVTQVKGKHVFLDAGTESGLDAGMKLRLHHLSSSYVTDLQGKALGQENGFGIRVEVSSTYPAFSIAAPEENFFSRAQVKVGDLLYLSSP